MWMSCNMIAAPTVAGAAGGTAQRRLLKFMRVSPCRAVFPAPSTGSWSHRQHGSGHSSAGRASLTSLASRAPAAQH